MARKRKKPKTKGQCILSIDCTNMTASELAASLKMLSCTIIDIKGHYKGRELHDGRITLYGNSGDLQDWGVKFTPIQIDIIKETKTGQSKTYSSNGGYHMRQLDNAIDGCDIQLWLGKRLAKSAIEDSFIIDS